MGGPSAAGQLLPIDGNQALFALIGTTYGGNGANNFALPDLRAITPNGMTYSICSEGIFPAHIVENLGDTVFEGLSIEPKAPRR